ncbi:SdpI family protein [Flavobacterium hungaricum]|uniref:SdpI/YhfL protein family protein n=1 Tax=Flavobacterium hungaricum TaxID=2082725 RepID=A0ABR9TP94_9FLAO|nr:SdpI family protein [Flavobacterium hungaricum]MBE8727199.1 hypothetical protein [Flavobacterium hungaricum]
MKIITLLSKSPIFIICLLIFIVCRLFPPKKINDFYGYRTANSKKNQSNWDFAQKYSNNLFIILLLFMIAIQVVWHYVDPKNPNADFMSVIGLFLIIAIVYYKTEKKLKKMSS